MTASGHDLEVVHALAAREQRLHPAGLDAATRPGLRRVLRVAVLRSHRGATVEHVTGSGGALGVLATELGGDLLGGHAERLRLLAQRAEERRPLLVAPGRELTLCHADQRRQLIVRQRREVRQPARWDALDRTVAAV